MSFSLGVINDQNCLVVNYIHCPLTMCISLYLESVTFCVICVNTVLPVPNRNCMLTSGVKFQTSHKVGSVRKEKF